MNYKKHFILTSGRCGSNYLANTLNLNPKVVNYGEALGEWTLLNRLHEPFFKHFDLTKERYLNALYKKRGYYYAAQCYSAYAHLKKNEQINWKPRNQIATLGLKDFFINIKRDNLYDFFLSDKKISVIHLTRSNLLSRLVSAIVMKKAGVVSTSAGQKRAKRFFIDVAVLKAKLDRDDRLSTEENEFATKIAKRQPFYQLSYEDYFASPENTFKHNSQIFDFLEVDNSSKKSNHRKILSTDLTKVIENYDEVESALRGTKYEHFLS